MNVQEFRTGATKSNLETIHSKEENKRLKTTLVDLRDRLSHLEGQNLGLQRDLDGLRHDGDVREKELERENDQLKTDVTKLRAEIDSVMRELQHIMDSKISLEMEISAYRKLLEGEEHRLVELEDHMIKARKAHPAAPDAEKDSESAKQNPTKSFQYSSSYRSSTKPGDVPRFSYQRSSKGPCGIAESSSDGKFVVVENTGRKDEDLGGWIINRIINGVDQLEYVLDDKFTISANSKIKMWSRGSRPYGAQHSDIEAKIGSWGTGDSVVTRLLSPTGEERATYTQKIAN